MISAMKNPTDRERLLADLFSDSTPEDFRDASLAHALSKARRGRAQRRTSLAVTGIATLAALAVSIPFVFKAHQSPGPAISSIARAKAPPGAASKVRIINDDELLNLFPDRAVALVGPSNHRQLVFLDVEH
jgi:hypothetical protein